ncbi:MAG TPA: hypothetical protein VH395_00140 [Jatrophihabitantaceae bacterium]|jgi:hypothetical protein
MTRKADYAMQMAAEITREPDEAIAALTRIRALLDHARKVSPSERAVIYAADLQAALDGVDRDGPRKTGGNG